MEETKYYCPECGAELTLDRDDRETWFEEDDILVVETAYFCDDCDEAKIILVERYRLSLIDSATEPVED